MGTGENATGYGKVGHIKVVRGGEVVGRDRGSASMVEAGDGEGKKLGVMIVEWVEDINSAPEDKVYFCVGAVEKKGNEVVVGEETGGGQ